MSSATPSRSRKVARKQNVGEGQQGAASNDSFAEVAVALRGLCGEPVPMDGAQSDEEGESTVSAQALQSAAQQVKRLPESTTEQSPLWPALADGQVSNKAVVKLCERALRGKQVTERSIAGAQLYVALLQQKGSSVYGFFHEWVLRDLFNIIKIQVGSTPTAPGEKGKKRKATSPAKGGRRTKRSTAQAVSMDLDEEEDDVAPAPVPENEDEHDDGPVGPRGNAELDGAVQALCADVAQMLTRISFAGHTDTLQHAVEVLALAGRSEFAFYSKFGYDAMLALLDPLHGVPSETFLVELRALVPSVLMTHAPRLSNRATLPRELLAVRDGAVDFLRHVLHSPPPGAAADAMAPPVRTLVQHLCVGVPDRAPYRAQLSKALGTVVEALPEVERAKTAAFLLKYSRNKQAAFRLFACEAALALLETLAPLATEGVPKSRRASNAGPSGGAVSAATVTALFRVVLARVSDKNPRVRAKALSALAEAVALGTQSPLVGTVVHQCLGLAPEGSTSLAAVASLDVSGLDDTVGLDRTEGVSISLGDDAAGLAGLLSTLGRRVTDPKAGVRRAAVQVVATIASSPLRTAALSAESPEIALLRDGCHDASPLVRKQALAALTEVVLAAPAGAARVRAAWARVALPMVLDPVATVQDACLAAVEQALLAPIAAGDESAAAAWAVVAALDGTQTKYLDRVFRALARKKALSSDFMAALQRGIDSESNGSDAVFRGSWLVLSEIAPYVGADLGVKPASVAQAWKTWRDREAVPLAETSLADPSDERERGEDAGVALLILRVLAAVMGRLQTAPAQEIEEDLLERLLAFAASPAYVTVAVQCLAARLEQAPGAKTKSGKGAKGSARGKAAAAAAGGEEPWYGRVWRAVEAKLAPLARTNRFKDDEALVVRLLFTLGEVAQFQGQGAGAGVPSSLQNLVQLIIAARATGDADTSRPAEESFDVAASQATAVDSLEVPPRVRAHAFLTLGKLCLASEALARKCVAALARELTDAKDAAVRSNVAVVMCDLCVRYTGIVDRHMGVVASLLRDPAPMVRRHALTLLTRLLQEDYIKWRGGLVFRFIRAMADSDPDIANFAKFCLANVLIVRYPLLFNTNFAESIFVLNDYGHHPTYNQFPQTPQERVLFALKGDAHRSSRRQLYAAMLSGLTDEQRFGLSAKLVQDVLGAVVDGVMPVPAAADSDAAAVLADTLWILACKDIKLRSAAAKDDADGDVVEPEDAAAANPLAAAKTKLLSKMLKKNTIENIIPVVVALKRQLEEQHSPLVRDLMLFLKELMKDYKAEVSDVMVADKRLAAELEYDLRVFEASQQQEMLAATPIAKTRSGGNMGPPRDMRASMGGAADKSLGPGAPATPARASPGFGTPLRPARAPTPREGPFSVPRLRPGHSTTAQRLLMGPSSVRKTASAGSGTPLVVQFATPSKQDAIDASGAVNDDGREREVVVPLIAAKRTWNVSPSPARPPPRQAAFSPESPEQEAGDENARPTENMVQPESPPSPKMGGRRTGEKGKRGRGKRAEAEAEAEGEDDAQADSPVFGKARGSKRYRGSNNAKPLPAARGRRKAATEEDSGLRPMRLDM